MTESLQEVRRRIADMVERVETENYYELLGVERGADKGEVLRRFRDLAKDWHADRFANIELDESDRQRVQEIFNALNNASRTLQNPDKRTEYDFELEAGGQDIEAVINAENAFRRGVSMMKSGNSKGAHDKFKDAHNLAPDEDEYRGYYLYTEYLQLPKGDDGMVRQKARAREIYEALDEISERYNEADWVLEFLGGIKMGLGELRHAKNLLNEALTMNPRNVGAKRQLRLIRMREEKSKDKGFFANLLDKLKGN